MKNELFFKIPDDQEVMAQLVEAIPADWSWLDGILSAPGHLIASGQVEENTGFSVSRFHIIEPTIIGNYDRSSGNRRKPNLFAIMVERKLPGFIFFHEAGYEAYVVTLDLAKRVAVGFIRKGYRGDLLFYSACYNNSKYNNPARCGMELKPWVGPLVFGEEAGEQPARVKLVWDKRYCGKEEDIAPIVAVCRSLGLQEYMPTASAQAVPL